MIIYILIILLIVCIKPNFVYDHNNKRFRNFGWNFSNISDSTSPTPLSVGSISVMLAIMIGCVVGLSDRNKPVEVVQKSKIYYLKVSPDGRMEVVKDIMQQVPQPIIQQVPQPIMQQVSQQVSQPLSQLVQQTIPYYEQPKFIPFYTGLE